MKLEPSDLSAIADSLVERLHQLELNNDRLGVIERIGYPEVEAAQLLGLATHVLRDARLRGEITAKKVGKRYIYSRQILLDFLQGGDTR